MGIPEYDELKVRIQPQARGGYEVLAFAPDGSTASGEFVLPFDETRLENFLLRVGRPRGAVRSGSFGSAEVESAQKFGSSLFNALFAAEVRDVYRRARERADAEEKGLRVTLYLSGAPDLQHIPWEFLYERPMFLAHSIETPVVRSLDLESVRRPRDVRLPLRILGIDSRPRGNVPLDADQERQNLEDALSELQERGLVELEWLERATLRELQRVLDRPDEFHIIHYIGHGAYDERSGTGTLLFEHRDGTTHYLTGEQLGSILYDERSLRLAVLNACEGARTSHHDPFSGVAASIVACGIPAVVGMQFEITDSAAVTFAEQLYTALADGLPVDACLTQARRAIWAEQHDTEFGTPVLFLRADDARLFVVDRTDRGEAEPAAEPAPAAEPPPAAERPPVAEPPPAAAEPPLAAAEAPPAAPEPPAPAAEPPPAAPPAVSPPREWRAELLHAKPGTLRVVRVHLTHESHIVTFRKPVIARDSIEVDGVEVARAAELKGDNHFTLSDGDQTLPAICTMKHSWYGGMEGISLQVAGQELYSDI